ncbi:arylesterase [Bartonella sp. HY329]|nr:MULTISPECIES: arylesterase [unclassified Bartonella]UXM96334.1 arylesterase [Bartonella sp. HY329]UXN10659.1 arylesterase [Bartonella sp. HY328]
MGEDQATDLDPSLIPNSPFRIIGFGDSLMAGYELPQDQSFTAVLEKKLHSQGYDVIVDNAGVSGDTTNAGLARLDWSVPEDAKLVILELGANDMLRGIEPEVTEQNLDAMLERLQNRKIPVLLAGMMTAPNMGAENAEKFNAIYPKLAEKYNITLYPFFLDGVAGQRQYQLSDGMHPNKEGVEIMVERFLPLMKAELKRLGVEPNNTDE